MITWNITALDTEAIREGKSDVVLSIHWEVYDTDAPEEKITGITGLMHDPEAPFVPYKSITKDLALSWLFQYINKDYYEEALTKKATAVEVPLSSGLPW